MNLRQNHDDEAAASYLASITPVQKAPGFSGGGMGGPLFQDAFRIRRQPSQQELIQAYRGLAYACAVKNANGVVRQQLRQFVTTGPGQARPKCLTKSYKRDSAGRQRVRKMAEHRVYGQYLRKAGVSGVEEVVESPLLESLDNPCDDFDRHQLFFYSVLMLDIAGWFFWSMEGGLLGKTEVFPLPSHYVQPIRETANLGVDYYMFSGQRYDKDDLVMGRHVSVNDGYAYPYGPMQAAFAYVGLVDKFVSVRDSILSSPRPGYFMSAKDPKESPGETERRRVEFEVNRDWGNGRVGGVKVVDGAWDFTPASHDLSDLTSAGVDDTGLEGVAFCFGVPVSMLKTRDVNKANAEEGRRQHAMDAVEPRCVGLATGITRWMHRQNKTRTTPSGKSLNWDRTFFAFDDPVTEERELDAKIFDMHLKSGLRTINQINDETGYDHVPWGDEPWLPSTWIQPTVAERMRQDAAAAAKMGAPSPESDLEEQANEDEQEADGKKKALIQKMSPPRYDPNKFPFDDEYDDHEDNTYGLPDGKPLRRALKRFYNLQFKQVLGILDKIGVDLPTEFASLTDYDDAMASAMTPIISAFYDWAGKVTMGKIGLDPDAWRVIDPNVHRTIADATLAFCNSTNQTTTKTLNVALADLRKELHEGIVEQGEAVPQLRKRVQSVFENMNKFKADQIARTETSRAVHAASQMSAAESGVVEGKEWLLSSNACPLCHELAAKSKGGIPLDSDFGRIGNNAEYADVKFPPGHPFCRCSVTYVLSEEYRNLIETATGKPAPEMIAPLDPKTKPIKRQAAAVA